ncbi:MULTISPECIES: sodium:solute symporter [unclassified Candidatus Cardinium]|uniref:sodium:solute symporter family protein n=1 Tax=unclassified Candidatus Cardinium TaxID=2641185 RepID=UPI001FB24025|nr:MULTISPECIES: hypothetical protein [unclassified Candidatus Cardinium]
MQIIAMAHAVSICLELDFFNPRIITIFATLILIFYSMFGGVRAVTITDVLQFVTFSIIIPFLAWFMFKKTGKSVLEVVSFIQTQEKFQFSSLCHFDTKLLRMVAMLLCIVVPDLGVPAVMQRVYMSSGPSQAKKVFCYTSLFSVVITSVILLIGLFVFVSDPGLLIKDVWDYIITNIPPILRAMVCISLLAMGMSTADSYLNSCSVMVSHDILASTHKENQNTDRRQLKIARWTTLIVGLSSMFLTFYSKDLLSLLMLSFAFSLPVITAPSLLAIFGFRGTSRTALIGMATGALSILAWNKWIKSTTDIDGAFVCMLANGLAMLAAHYLFKQPEGAGWVGPDTDFKQMQQAKARKSAERKEAIKNGWANRKATLAKLKPSHATIVFIGFYLAITSLVTHFIAPVAYNGSWLIVQLFVAAFFVGYPFIYDISKTIRGMPTGLGWLIGLVVYFPLNLFWNWSHSVDPIFTTSLFLSHFALILWSLPLDLGIAVIVVILLVAIYPISISFSCPLFFSLLPLLLVSLLLLAIIICLKVRQGNYMAQLVYLRNQEEIRSA